MTPPARFANRSGVESASPASRGARGRFPVSWSGRHVLVTAGPTREYLDPIRFLTNSSTGMMGFALARVARDRGAKVTVISGPAQVGSSWNMRVVRVLTAEQMHEAVLKQYKDADIIISAAAVGDWKFQKTSSIKIKKTGQPLQLTLLPNPDIIADVSRRLGRTKPKPSFNDGRILVGFALETSQQLAHAKEKLKRKGLDLIVANGPQSLGLSRTKISILDRLGGVEKFEAMSKRRAAEQILRGIERLF